MLRKSVMLSACGLTALTSTLSTGTLVGGLFFAAAGSMALAAEPEYESSTDTWTFTEDFTITKDNLSTYQDDNVHVSAGTLKVDRTGGDGQTGFTKLNASVAGGATLQLLTNVGALGWHNRDHLDKITLDGDSTTGVATLLIGDATSTGDALRLSVPYNTGIELKGDTMIKSANPNATASIRSDVNAAPTGAYLTISASGTNNTIATNFTSNDGPTHLNVAENGELTMTGASLHKLVKKGAGSLTFSGDGALSVTGLHVQAGSLSVERAASISGLTVDDNAALSVADGKTLTLNGATVLSEAITLGTGSTLSFGNGATLDVSSMATETTEGNTKVYTAVIASGNGSITGLTSDKIILGSITAANEENYMSKAFSGNTVTVTVSVAELWTADTSPAANKAYYVAADYSPEMDLTNGAQSVGKLTIRDGGTFTLKNGDWNNGNPKWLTAEQGINLKEGGTLVMNNNAVNHNTKVIGNGKIKFDAGSSTDIWSGNKAWLSEFAGEFELTSGTLVINNSGSFSSTLSAVTVSGGTIEAQTNNAFTGGNATVRATGGTFYINASTQTLGDMEASGSGTLKFRNLNSFTGGAITIRDLTSRTNAALILDASTINRNIELSTANTAILQNIWGNSKLAGTLSGVGDIKLTTVSNDNVGTFELAGAISHTGKVTVSGGDANRLFKLTASMTNTGDIVIEKGKFQVATGGSVGVNSAVGSSDDILVNGGTLQMTGGSISGRTIYAGTSADAAVASISGKNGSDATYANVDITKESFTSGGEGATMSNAAINITGAYSIGAMTLNESVVSVADGGTLKLTGNIDGTGTTVNVGSGISPASDDDAPDTPATATLDLTDVTTLSTDLNLGDNTTLILGDHPVTLTGALTMGQNITIDLSAWCKNDESVPGDKTVFTPYMDIFTYGNDTPLTFDNSLNGLRVSIIVDGYATDYGKLVVANDGKSLQLVPEPATATLSLLALAGLAARRRRK